MTVKGLKWPVVIRRAEACPMATIAVDDFNRIEMRVGRVVDV